VGGHRELVMRPLWDVRCKQKSALMIFYLRNDRFVQSYKGVWKEPGRIDPSWLDTADSHHMPHGIFLHGAYELSSTNERALGGSARGPCQRKPGADLARKSRNAGGRLVDGCIDQGGAESLAVSTSTCFPGTECNAYSNKRYTDSAQRQLHLHHCCEGTTQLSCQAAARYCSDTCKAEGERKHVMALPDSERVIKRKARWSDARTGVYAEGRCF